MTSAGDAPKSWSGPPSSGQFGLVPLHPVMKASFGVSWFHQRMAPVASSIAMMASLVPAAGCVEAFPVAT